MKRYYLLILLLLLALPVSAELNETGINLFNPEIGARPLGMGGAFVGRADDLNSILYNPGGMAWARGISLSFRDMENITAVQAYPTGSGSSVGLAIATTKYTDIAFSGGLAHSSSSLLLLSYGTKLNFLPALYKNEALQQVGIGLTLKSLMGETLRRSGQSDRSGGGWDMDLGVLWKRSDWWWFGLSAQNLFGSQISWDVGTAEAIPSALRLGTSARIIGDIGSPIFKEGRELLIGGEIDFVSNSSALLRLGGELGINKTYFLRAGIMQQGRQGAVTTPLNLGCGYRSGEWGADLVIYREPLRDESQFYFSILYFPKEWVVSKKLEFEKPGVVIETAIEKISLADNITTYDENLEVVGRVRSGVEVYVNGLRADTAADNSFKVIIPMALGKNLVLVEARYEGEKKNWKYKVLRKAKVQLAEEKALKKELASAIGPEAKAALEGQAAEIAQNREKVEELVTLGVIEVTPEAEFSVNASITRGELAAWVAKSAGMKLPKIDRDLYPDVKRNHPLAPYIKVVVDWNILRPFPDGNFRPDEPVSKEEGDWLFKRFGVKK